MFRFSILLLTIAAALPSHANKVAAVSSCGPTGGGEQGACGPQRQARTLLQHNAESMIGQTHRSSAREPLALREVDHAEQEAKDAANPGSLKNYITDQLLPTEEETKNQLQGEVNRAAEAFEACAMEMRTAQESLQQQESTLVKAEQRHSECEMKVRLGNKTEEEMCGNLETYAAKLEAPVELAQVNASDISALVEALGTMNDYFNDVYPQLQDKRKKCEVAKSEEKVTQEQCDADKQSIEQSWCSLKAERVRSCNSFDTCFSGKDKRFDEVKKYVEELEKNSKENFKTLACHGDPSCNAGEADASHLSISYPSKPLKMQCDADVRSNWNYSHVSCSGDTIDATSVAEESSAPSDSTSNDTTK